MFKEPDYRTIQAPRHILQKIEKGAYIHQQGNLRFATSDEILMEYLKYYLPIFIISTIQFYYIPAIIATASTIIILILYTVVFYYFGWKKEFTAWYIFDQKNQLLSVIMPNNQQWIDIEIPYEDIQEIKWKGTKNGKAIIIAPPFKLPTYRQTIKQRLNVTEIWDELAKIHAPMTNWKFTLKCPIDGATFGHHIGTARCPDHENVILLLTDHVSEINSTTINPNDIDRV